VSWRGLIQSFATVIHVPWCGEREVTSGDRTWRLRCRPREHGWYSFTCDERDALTHADCEPFPGKLLYGRDVGYVVGDRFVPDVPRPGRDARGERVNLLPPDSERDHFDRVRVGRHCEGGPLVYSGPDFPLGPEDAARRCLDDGGDLLAEEGVTPGLYAAFRLEQDQRQAAARARQLAQERAEAERRQEEARRLMGDAQGRRELAGADFDAACAAALRVGGAEFLETRLTGRDMAVRFRLPDLGRRFECVVDRRTLSVVEAGVCLTDEETGERGDHLFTLESLPGVIREAHRLGVLVVFRHV